LCVDGFQKNVVNGQYDKIYFYQFDLLIREIVAIFKITSMDRGASNGFESNGFGSSGMVQNQGSE
jgi:hypothetical protein